MEEQAAEKIARLEEEIHLLRRENKLLVEELGKNTFRTTLRDAFRFFETADAIKATGTGDDFLVRFLNFVARVMGAEGVSILLHDRKTGELFFREAVGEKAEEVKRFRLKSNEGIAGYCFTTGQTLAVSDVNKDSRFKRDISQSINMPQQALIASPIIYRDEVIGVMEAVNKRGGGTFCAQEVELFSMVADFAGHFVEKVNVRRDLQALFLLMVKNILHSQEITDFSPQDLLKLARTLEKDLLPSKDLRDALELAALIEDIIRLGPDEYEFVRDLLSRFRVYLQERGRYNESTYHDWVND